MALTRIALLGWPGSAARSEYGVAARALHRVLSERGITVVDAQASPQGFIALPGQPDTLAEVFATTLDRDGAADRPCGLLNTAGFFSALLQAADDATVERFARESQRGRLVVAAEPAELVEALLDYRPPESRRLTREPA